MSVNDLVPKIITGSPGVKANPRADFVPDMFDQLITTKGYRMWWSRAGVCPCEQNKQTQQPQLNCPLCRGKGYFYYLPDVAVIDGSPVDAYGNAVDLNTAGDGVSIYVVKTALTEDVQVFEKFGEWVFGTTRGTVQWQNRLGYRDRLVERDSVMPWNQIVITDGTGTMKVTGGFDKAGIRYPVVELIYCRSIAREYRLNRDLILTPTGELEWMITPPDPKTRLSITYTMHPVWIVMDYVHAIRDTLVSFKAKAKADEFRKLPLQAMMKLDFLVEPEGE